MQMQFGNETGYGAFLPLKQIERQGSHGRALARQAREAGAVEVGQFAIHRGTDITLAVVFHGPGGEAV